MNKLLTISIAAYNSEDTVRKALDSIILEDRMHLLEVFVIDDGGIDETLNIAKAYQKKYPNTIIPVHKENGGYGTTVNYSIQHATGKYFKILDGDDWFDKEEFSQLIDLLESEDSDIIVGNYYQGPDEKQLKLIKTHTESEGFVIDLRNGYTCKTPYNMWEIVYKTSILRDNDIKLPAGVLYTDRYYFTIPFAFANIVRFTDNATYCYRIGRDGQSMSVESQVKHLQERMDGSLFLCHYYEQQKKINNPRCKYLLPRVTVCHVAAASVVRHLPKCYSSKKVLMDYENKVTTISDEIIRQERKHGQFGLFLFMCRSTNYLFYSLTPDCILKKK